MIARVPPGGLHVHAARPLQAADHRGARRGRRRPAPRLRRVRGTPPGRVPLTPIQRWFLEQRARRPRPLEPGIPPRGAADVDADLLEQALASSSRGTTPSRCRAGTGGAGAPPRPDAVAPEVALSTCETCPSGTPARIEERRRQWRTASLDLVAGRRRRGVTSISATLRGAAAGRSTTSSSTAYPGAILLEDLEAAYQALRCRRACGAAAGDGRLSGTGPARSSAYAEAHGLGESCARWDEIEAVDARLPAHTERQRAGTEASAGAVDRRARARGDQRAAPARAGRIPNPDQRRAPRPRWHWRCGAGRVATCTGSTSRATDAKSGSADSTVAHGRLVHDALIRSALDSSGAEDEPHGAHCA